MTGGSSATASSPALPWKTKLLVSALSFIVDTVRRSDGTINRFLLSLLDPAFRPNARPVRGVRTADVDVDSGRDLWFRLYLPETSQDSAAGSLPVVVYFHGGGFAMFSPASWVFDGVCRRFCSQIPAAVISVNYGLAPEHRCPASYGDGLDVLRFLGVGPDVSRGGGPGGSLLREFFEVADLSSCFLVGDSAGGNIAHNVARRWSARGESSMPHGRVRVAGLVAIQPFFGGEGRVDSELRLTGAPVVHTEFTDWVWRAFLPEGADRDHEAANPEAAVEGLGAGPFPPTIVVVGGFDPLQDWQRRYYEALKKKGKEATLVEYPGAIHGFYAFPELKETPALMDVVRGFVLRQKRGRSPAGDEVRTPRSGRGSVP